MKLFTHFHDWLTLGDYEKRKADRSYLLEADELRVMSRAADHAMTLLRRRSILNAILKKLIFKFERQPSS